MKKINIKKIKIEPGTDITALTWKGLQSVQIQKQLDKSHNLYNFDNNDNKNNNENNHDKNKKSLTKSQSISSSFINLPKNIFFYLLPYKNQIILNIDDDNDYKNNHDNNKNSNDNTYFNQLYSVLSTCSSLNENNQKIQELVIDSFINNPTIPQYINTKAENDILLNVQNYYSNITNFIDLRKNKKWVQYCLSDNVIRYGAVEPHIIFNKMPAWLVDALQIAFRLKLYLLYSTDIRGVNQWLGQTCSLINLHNLLNLNSKHNDINYTALLIHTAGLLSTNTLNSINRQGMSFPENALQKSTFENVKRKLSNVKNVDNLSSFISLSLMCLPQKSGTNFFDLIN